MKVFEDIEVLIWLKNNVMKANADKFHQLLSSKVEVCAEIGTGDIQSSEHWKLLGFLLTVS